MPDPCSIEAPFEPFIVGDETFAGAYEALGAVRRARLKARVALLYESFGETPLRERREREFRQGFTLVEADEGPCPAVTFVCDDGYPHWEGLLAAVMPALTAGARPRILFRRVSGTVAPFLLAALELAGVEEVWHLDDAAVLDFFRRTAPDGRARLVLLGGDPFGEALILGAHRSGALCRSLFGPPPGDFWPHLDSGWFRLRSRQASTPNRK